MANILLDEEIDPSARYLKEPKSSVSAVGAPDIYKSMPTPAFEPRTSKVDLTGLTPDLKKRIDEASAAWLADKELNPKGEAFPVSSAFRTNDKQSQLFADRASNPNLVAPPGYSKHEKGMGCLLYTSDAADE